VSSQEKPHLADRPTAGPISWMLRLMSQAGGETGELLANHLAARLPVSREMTSRVIARRRGLTYSLDLRDNVQRSLYFTGSYARPVLKLLLSETSRGDTVVDVGAHVGVYALPIGRKLDLMGDGRIYAFEPAPDNISALRWAAHANGVISISVVPLALGMNRATLSLRDSERFQVGDSGVRSLHGHGRVASVVEVVPYDEWASAECVPAIDVIKIDVEGGEVDVLLGMINSIRSARPRCILLEVVPAHLERAGRSVRELAQLVRELDYVAEGPTIEEIASGRRGRLGSNVLLRPRETRPRRRFRTNHGVAYRTARAASRVFGALLRLGRRGDR
jgi:FkbM family methyltransferase